MEDAIEIQCVEQIKNSEQIVEEAYLLANPDVRRSGMSARFHFENYGIHEAIRVQYLNINKIVELRNNKLKRVEFLSVSNRGWEGYSLNCLTENQRHELGVTDLPPISFNQYDFELVDEFRRNPDKLFLDVGAGLRKSVFSNVINVEIFPYLSTDVICMGEELPFADCQFDKVICIAVLEHTRKPWKVAEELCRVLKPGGKLIIDYPFLQPVHGYPHHYFNATPKGNSSLFEAQCVIDSCEVAMNQSPIFSLCWMLNLWVSGLSSDDGERFKDMNLHEILSKHPVQHLEKFYCKNLDKNVEKLISAGSTLRATKRFPADDQRISR